MTPLPGSVGFKAICPELGLIIDIQFDGHSLISTVITHLTKLLCLKGTDYYLTDGRILDSRLKLKDAIREGASYLLLSHKDRNSLLDQNLERALEQSPESFLPSTKKILIEIWINEHKMKGFLDSGAMHSILSVASVTGCGLQLMVDPRFQDEARGIGGNQNSSGKIYNCPLKIAGHAMPVSFLVMDGAGSLLDSEEALLGMDFIHKYVKSIDFQEERVIFKNGSEMRSLN